MVKYPRRSKRKMTYHGRIGRPVIHKCKTTEKTFVMVRKKGGGSKRLYLDHGHIPERHK